MSTQNYTVYDIIKYTIALLVSMFFSFFVFMDVSMASNIWIRIFRSTASFPYVCGILMSIYIIKNEIRYDLNEDDIPAFFVMIGICIILLVASFSWRSGLDTLSRVSSFPGLMAYLYLHTIPSSKKISK